MYAVPDQVPFVVNSTPSSWSGVAALLGTVTVIVFQAFVVRDDVARQAPVHAQPPLAPCNT